MVNSIWLTVVNVFHYLIAILFRVWADLNGLVVGSYRIDLGSYIAENSGAHSTSTLILHATPLVNGTILLVSSTLLLFRCRRLKQSLLDLLLDIELVLEFVYVFDVFHWRGVRASRICSLSFAFAAFATFATLATISYTLTQLLFVWFSRGAHHNLLLQIIFIFTRHYHHGHPRVPGFIFVLSHCLFMSLNRFSGRNLLISARLLDSWCGLLYKIACLKPFIRSYRVRSETTGTAKNMLRLSLLF